MLARLSATVPPGARRLLTFLFVGGIGIFSNLGGVLLCRGALGESAASVAGAGVGVLSNFALHCRLTFRDRLQHGTRGRFAGLRLFAEFCASSAVAVAAQLLAARWLRSVGVDAAAAQFAGILCGTALNFVSQNWLVFRAPRGKARRSDALHEEPHAV